MIKNLLAYDAMLDEAFLTGVITEHEYKLLSNISINYGIYEKDVYAAMENGFIKEDEAEHLRILRKTIYENALRTSLKKGTITEEEDRILKILKGSVGLDDATLGDIESNIKKEVRYKS